jgi:hypothetical protein
MNRGMLFTLCVFLVVPTASALAKKPKKKIKKLGPVVEVTVAGNTASTQGQDSVATATCPIGKQAVGGGFVAPLLNNRALIVHSSFRSAPNAWTVAGQVAEGSGAVTAYAYCRNASAGPITDITASTSLSTTGETKTLTPSCPGGTRLIGGGFNSTVPSTMDAVVFPQVNQATSPTTWTVTGVENQDGAITLTAHAYCMARIAAPVFVAGTSAGSGGVFVGASGRSAICPAPKKAKKGKKGKKGKKRRKKPPRLLSGGGFSANPVNGASGAPIVIFGQSRDTGAGDWLASAVNGSSSAGSFSVTSQGICF